MGYNIVRILYTDWLSKSEDDPRTLEQYLHDIAEIGEVVYEPYRFGVKIGECVSSLHYGEYGYLELIGNKREVLE